MWQPAQSAKLPDFGAGAAEMERGGETRNGSPPVRPTPGGAPLGNKGAVPCRSWEKKSKNKQK